jgi:hypothetical protein
VLVARRWLQLFVDGAGDLVILRALLYCSLVQSPESPPCTPAVLVNSMSRPSIDRIVSRDSFVLLLRPSVVVAGLIFVILSFHLALL